MAIKFKIRQGDPVVVIAGRHKGARGKVLQVLPSEGRVVVEGVNMVTRHQKPVGEQPGQRIQKEAPIHISNVALWSEAEQRTVKVGFQRREDGRKVRVDKKTGAEFGA
ncbi:MAG: 50S ribosomal protein L24 [Alphaproteobacteria bacterium]|nr:50S ribosomal protein L24 [Alphaproteobacteria bacterium]